MRRFTRSVRAFLDALAFDFATRSLDAERRQEVAEVLRSAVTGRE